MRALAYLKRSVVKLAHGAYLLQVDRTWETYDGEIQYKSM